jgi:riboflavin biosynthesis pyrimidine reductase
MRPRVILHMGSSIDGRIAPTRWPEDLTAALRDAYERIHLDLEGDAWIVGRVTMAAFAEGEPAPAFAKEVFPRRTWKAPGAEHGPYAIAVDQHARLHLNSGRAGGDPIVLILAETAPDDYLAELRRDGVSYIFAGRTKIDLALALQRLNEDFGVMRLLLEGGGGINGAFLSAGLIDEVSLIIIPVADGQAGAPTTFDQTAGNARALRLRSVERLDGDALHVRYDLI